MRENADVKKKKKIVQFWFYSICESTFLSVSSSFFDVLKALKISVDFIVQCVWLLEHVKLFPMLKTHIKAHRLDQTR